MKYTCPLCGDQHKTKKEAEVCRKILNKTLTNAKVISKLPNFKQLASNLKEEFDGFYNTLR